MNIAFIPARGGSKSIPLKNIKTFCGKPLIYWTISALQNANNIDRIVLATDSLEIKEIALSFGLSKVVVFNRDNENASDTASTESVMLEYISKSNLSKDDIFILVQATSPFTTSHDFDSALNMFRIGNYDSMISVVPNKRFYWNQNGQPINYDYCKRPRRQDFEGYFMENGAFYVNTVAGVLDCNNRLRGRIGYHVMPEFTGFEIDEPSDWMICEMLMRQHVLSRRCSSIKVFITDVDGVLTDTGMYYSEKGDELKKFSTLDGKGFELLRAKNINTAIITSENTAIVDRRAKKLKIDYLYQGVQDKLSVATEICRKENIELENVAYIGDDLNDIELLMNVGFAACPANAMKEVKDINGIRVMQRRVVPVQFVNL